MLQLAGLGLAAVKTRKLRHALLARQPYKAYASNRFIDVAQTAYEKSRA